MKIIFQCDFFWEDHLLKTFGKKIYGFSCSVRWSYKLLSFVAKSHLRRVMVPESLASDSRNVFSEHNHKVLYQMEELHHAWCHEIYNRVF